MFCRIQCHTGAPYVCVIRSSMKYMYVICTAVQCHNCLKLWPGQLPQVPASLLLPQVQKKGMPFAHTHLIPWPELQDTLPPAQSDMFLTDVPVIQVLTPRQAAGTDPASGPSWTLSPPDALQVLAQAGTASSNSVSHKPLDYFKAAVDEGLPHGRRNQIGTTAHSGGQAQPAPGPSNRRFSLMERFWKKEEIPPSLNPLAVSWDPVMGLSRASPHVYSGANAHTAPTHGHLSRGARAVTPPTGYPHIMPQWPHNSVAAGGDLDTSESGMSDDEDESAAHLRLPSYPKVFVRNLVSCSSGARAVSPPPGLEHIMPHPHDNVAAGGVLDRDAEHAADPGRQPERPRCHISEKGKRRSKARALNKKKACREARLLRERQMQSVGT